MMACKHCTAPNGDIGYPYYGLAPHVHTQPLFGTKFTGEVPDNFLPDPDEPGCGTWYCPACKAGMAEDLAEDKETGNANP